MCVSQTKLRLLQLSEKRILCLHIQLQALSYPTFWHNPVPVKQANPTVLSAAYSSSATSCSCLVKSIVGTNDSLILDSAGVMMVMY